MADEGSGASRLVASTLTENLGRLGLDLSQPFALAVSGGPDSMALVRAVQQAGLSAKAYVVDHGMRRESAAEADWVAEQLFELGVDREILTISPAPKGMNNAREARYALMSAAMRAEGVSALLTGHHRDDQAETLALRLERGSGLRGLAGMSAVSVLNRDLSLCRPLLSLSKQQLLLSLEEVGQGFLSDPSNENSAYRRAYWRAVLNREPCLAAELLAFAQQLGRLRRSIERAALDVLAGVELLEHQIVLPKDSVDSQPTPVRIEILRRLAQALSGRALGDLDPLTMQTTQTGQGCLFIPRNGEIIIKKDPRVTNDDSRAIAQRLDRGVFAIV